RADFVEVLGLARAAGLVLRPTWVPFTPWTPLDDYRVMLDFIARERLAHHTGPVRFSIRLLVPPGSLLLESEAMRPYLGELVQDAFHYRWTHPDPRMDRLHAEVSPAVAEGADGKHDPQVTFARIAALADAAGGASSAWGAPRAAHPNPGGAPPPPPPRFLL